MKDNKNKNGEVTVIQTDVFIIPLTRFSPDRPLSNDM
jgi:hypothetical protein